MAGRLFDTIRTLVMQGRYVVGQHASERLEERGILEWQVVDAIDRVNMFVEHPHAVPNPTVEALQILPDGTNVKAVWAYLISADIAKLVTVHYFDE